jgi:HAD superfamily hydrolase (TIGR01509 family)
MSSRRVVRAILLDAGGIILHPNLDWIAGQVASSRGVTLSRQQLFEGYYRTILEVDLRRGPVTPQGAPLYSYTIRCWFFGRLLAHAGLPEATVEEAGAELARAAQQTFPRESDIYHWAMPGTRERLLQLSRRGFLLGVASNNDGALEAQLGAVGVRDLFGVALDSGVEGVSKPDPELLLRAARALDVPPALCLFCGDVDRVDGAAARAAGMAFALLDPLHQPRPAGPFTVSDLPSLLEHFVPPGEDPEK